MKTAFLYKAAVLAVALLARLPADEPHWGVTQIGPRVEISHGQNGNFPQYAALDLNSGYFRLIPDTSSGWGTSVVLVPCFWSGGAYYQGTRVTCTSLSDGADLVLTVRSSYSIGAATLQAVTQVRLQPPGNRQLFAQVSTTTSGTVPLDHRPGEAFKPVMLSSMHVSATQWDCRQAFLGTATSSALPADGWVLQPTTGARRFGLRGGTSVWKPNAPTVEVMLDDAGASNIAGWVTSSLDPNADNIALWAASTDVLHSWSYKLVSKADSDLPVARRLVSISTRGFAGDGEQTMIAGFAISGSSPERVLIRAVGPTLQNYGVVGTMPDPFLRLFDQGGRVLYENDDWGNAPDPTAITQAGNATGAFPLTGKDAAILVNLFPGVYTAQASSQGRGAGVVLLEVYELDE